MDLVLFLSLNQARVSWAAYEVTSHTHVNTVLFWGDNLGGHLNEREQGLPELHLPCVSG
jgi:hypothetical protein